MSANYTNNHEYCYSPEIGGCKKYNLFSDELRNHKSQMYGFLKLAAQNIC